MRMLVERVARRVPDHEGIISGRAKSCGWPREDLQERQLCAVLPQLAGRRPCRWRRDVDQPAEELVEGCLGVIDGGPLVVCEGDGSEHAPEVRTGATA
jgi:hypothetical protein